MSAASYALLRLRDFRLLLFTRMAGMMALQAQAVIIGWQVYSLTKDPLLLGLTGLAEAAPAIACSLFSGHVVDTGRPRWIYIACMAALTLNTALLYAAAGGFLPLEKNALLIWIFSGIFISGVARSFITPSFFVVLSRTVKKSDMPAASAWMSGGFQLAAVTGPAIAGLIYGGYGARIAWLAPLLLLGAATCMTAMIAKDPAGMERTTRPSAIASIREGWAFIMKTPVLLSVMALDMFAVLLGGAVAMLPAYADQILHVGSEGLGLLRAAPAIGAGIVALWLALRPMKEITGLRFMIVVAGFGFCMIGFGLSRVFGLSLFFLILSGAFDGVSVVIRSTLMQWLTPDSMRGRVSAVSSMFIISSNEIGAFESGVVARLLGLVPSVVFGGMGTLIIVALTAILSPGLRKAAIQVRED